METWRKPKAGRTSESFDERVAKHAAEVEARLWEEGESRVGRRLLAPGGPNNVAPVARPLSELLAEAETQQVQEGEADEERD